MAVICPITEKPVLYLTCLECEDKVCKNNDVTLKNDTNKKENIMKRDSENE